MNLCYPIWQNWGFAIKCYKKTQKINYNKHISVYNYKSTDGIGYHVNYFIRINPAEQVKALRFFIVIFLHKCAYLRKIFGIKQQLNMYNYLFVQKYWKEKTSDCMDSNSKENNNIVCIWYKLMEYL